MKLDFQHLTITKLRQLITKRQVSIVEVTQSALDRISATDTKLKAFLTINSRALSVAKKYDQELGINADFAADKPLLGIPFGIKDLFVTENLRTTAGSKIIDNYFPQYSATVVKRLEAAGAIIIGKNNLDAWGHGSSGENSDYYPTTNPWNTAYVPGGSSSGGAVSVATGQVMAATGSDTGSSVRLPAAFCNVVGLKPTYGRVSRYGIIAMASSLDTIGHFTKTVLENALILEVTAGQDAHDATTSSLPAKPYTKISQEPLKKYTVGIPKEYFAPGIDDEVLRLTQNAIKVLEKMGIKTKTVSLPHTKVAMACYYIIVPSEVSSNLARYDGVRYGHDRSYFGPEAKRRIIIGTHTLSSGYYDAYYRQALKVRTLVKQDFDQALKDVDFIIAPSSPTPPFKIGAKSQNSVQMYLTDIFLCPVNLAGHPSLNVPVGFTSKKLPVGMQIIAPHFAEEKIYHLAYHFEQATKFYTHTPNI